MRLADGGYEGSVRTNGIDGSANWTLREGNDRFGVMSKDAVTLATVYVRASMSYDIVERGGVKLRVLVTLKVKRLWRTASRKSCMVYSPLPITTTAPPTEVMFG